MREVSSYETQARQFLKACGARIKICFLRYGQHYGPKVLRSNDKEGRNIYRVRIDRKGKSFSFRFGDSLQNTWKNKRPGRYCVLACLTKYEPEADVWDFAKEYGYEITDRQSYYKVLGIYNAVRREYGGVKRIFGDVIDEFREIQ